MDNFESVWYSIIFSLKCSEWGKNWVIDSFNQDNLLKRIIVLRCLVLLIPAIDSVLRYLVWVVSKVTSLNFVYHKIKTWFSSLFSRLLNNRIFHYTILIHKIAQKLRAQAHSILCSWILWEVFLEKDGESWVPVESLWAEVAEWVTVCHINQDVFLDIFRDRRVKIIINSLWNGDSTCMPPSWLLILKPTSKNLLRVSASSKPSCDLCIRGICYRLSLLFIILFDHPRHSHLVNACILLILNHIDCCGWRDWTWRLFLRHDYWLCLDLERWLMLLLLPSSNFIVHELLLLLCNLLLHLIKLLLSILYDIIDFIVLNFRLQLFILFFRLFVDFTYFLKLLLYDILRLFTEPWSGALEPITLLRS